MCLTKSQLESCNTYFTPTFAEEMQLSRAGTGVSSKRRLVVLQHVYFLLCCANKQSAVVDVRAIAQCSTKACPFPILGP